jgi:sirohydrochlorin cobaltochelatase
MGIGFKTLFTFALAASAVFANEDLRFADSCYAARAERAKGDKADAHNAKLMIDAYRKATGDASVEEAATEGYVKSLFFSFRFVPFDKNKRSRKLDSLKAATEDAYGKFPKNKEIAHIYASALSMWGADKNPLQAVKDGVDDVLGLPYYIAEGTLTFELIPAKLGLSAGSRGVAEVDGKKVRIRMAPAFGTSRILTNFLTDRIADAGGDMDTGILVLGHGSRDLTSSNEEIISLNASRLTKMGYRNVVYAFNEFVEPIIADALKTLASKDVKRIIAVPLFIASGVHLGEEIPEQLGIPAYSAGGQIEVSGKKIELVYTKPVEDDGRITDLLVSKIADFRGE